MADETTISSTYRVYGFYEDDDGLLYDVERDASVLVAPAPGVADAYADLTSGNVVDATVRGDPDTPDPWRVEALEARRDDRLEFHETRDYVPKVAARAWSDRGRGEQVGVTTVTDDRGNVVAEFQTHPQHQDDVDDVYEGLTTGALSLEEWYAGDAAHALTGGVDHVIVHNPHSEPFVTLALFPPESEEADPFRAAITEDDDGGAADEGGDGDGPEEFEYDWQESTDVSMADVGGMESVKAELRDDVIRPMTVDRERAEEFGIPLPNVLLYGPPGTGKTYLAKALVDELDLPFVLLSGNDVTSKWINQSADRIDRLFTEARHLADREGGAVVFLDELDAVLPSRSGGQQGHAEDRKVVNEFLNHLQEASENDVLFVGATNKRGDLDEAATRAGRIDKEIHVGLPDEAARESILRAQFDGRPHDLSGASLADVAAATAEFTAADLASLVEDAARHALFTREGEAICEADVEAVLDERVRELDGATDAPDPTSVGRDADRY